MRPIENFAELIHQSFGYLRRVLFHSSGQSPQLGELPVPSNPERDVVDGALLIEQASCMKAVDLIDFFGAMTESELHAVVKLCGRSINSEVAAYANSEWERRFSGISSVIEYAKTHGQ